MRIRDETADDANIISELITEAFATAPHASGTEAQVVTQLRDRGELSISLVAEIDNRIVGHIAFSPVVEAGDPTWLTLGPIAVLPEHQGQGIGSALMNAGMDRAIAEGWKGVMLVGDPAYYSRFGFTESSTMTLPGIDAQYILERVFTGAPLSGEVQLSPAFGL